MSEDKVPFHYLPIGQALPSQLDEMAKEYVKQQGNRPVCPTCNKTEDFRHCSNSFHIEHLRYWAEKLADDISKGDD